MFLTFPELLSLAETFRIPLASISKVTSIFGTPRGAGGMPVRSKVPRRLLSLVSALSPSYTWIVTAGWLSEYVVKVWVCLQGILELRSIILVMTPPAVSIPKDRGATSTSNTSWILESVEPHHRTDFLWSEGLAFAFEFHLNLWFSTVIHYFERPVFDVLLYFWVVEFSPNESFGVENCVAGVHSYLVLGGIPDEAFCVGEGYITWCCSVTLVVGDDLDLPMLPDTNAGVRGAQIDTNCWSFNHFFCFLFLYFAAGASVRLNQSETENSHERSTDP
nr:unnamed protein product [Callosobruchus analis]